VRGGKCERGGGREIMGPEWVKEWHTVRGKWGRGGGGGWLVDRVGGWGGGGGGEVGGAGWGRGERGLVRVGGYRG